jgi:general secretion pathway protein I
MRRVQGFSLLEVLVAFVVLALSLAVVMRIFAGGLDNIGSANRYTQALHLAQSLLDAQGRETPLTMGETSGETLEETGAGLEWRISVTPFQTENEATPVAEHPVQLVRIDVRVQWDRERKTPRSLDLTTLRVAARN